MVADYPFKNSTKFELFPNVSYNICTKFLSKNSICTNL